MNVAVPRIKLLFPNQTQLRSTSALPLSGGRKKEQVVTVLITNRSVVISITNNVLNKTNWFCTYNTTFLNKLGPTGTKERKYSQLNILKFYFVLQLKIYDYFGYIGFAGIATCLIEMSKSINIT